MSGRLIISNHAVDARFGGTISNEYWGIVPFALYKYQGQLGLSNSEIWFLTWVCMHAWDEKDAFPSISALSRYSGRSRNYIQQIIRSLEAKGLIESKPRYEINGARASNYYEIRGLLTRLEDEIGKDQRSQYNKKQPLIAIEAKEAVQANYSDQ